MNYKYVPVSKTMHVRVPENLTPDQEANYIASRIAFVNFDEVEAGIQEDLKLFEQGKMIEMGETLADLKRESAGGMNKDG